MLMSVSGWSGPSFVRRSASVSSRSFNASAVRRCRTCNDFATPETIHLGRAAKLTRQRSINLDAAFLAHPERFKHVAPSPPEVPLAAWINPPKKKVPATAKPSTLAL